MWAAVMHGRFQYREHEGSSTDYLGRTGGAIKEAMRELKPAVTDAFLRTLPSFIWLCGPHEI